MIVRAGDTRLALQVDVVIDIRERGTRAPTDSPVAIAALVPALRDARWIDEP